MKSSIQEKHNGQTWPWVGQSRLGAALLSMLDTGRWPATVMFIGPANLGKKTVAQWLAQRDLCQKSGAPCQTCINCKAVAAGTHPDCFFITSADNQQFGTAEVQQALHGVGWKRAPNAHGRRWIIIADIERLSEYASNALLKIIEEPPADTTIVMTTSKSETILPTILSRAVQFRWQRVAKAKLDEYVRSQWPKLTVNARQTIVAQADGRPGLLITTGEDRMAVEREWRETTELMTAIETGQLPARTEWSIADIDRFERIIRDSAMAVTSGQARYWPDQTEDFKRLGKALGVHRIVEIAHRLLNRPIYLQQNVQPSMFIHDLIL